MASEIRVDKITSLSGVGTITPSPTGIDIAGITTVATLKATTGIVTTLTATTGIVTTFEATTGDITTLRTPTGIATHFTADKISLPDSGDGAIFIGVGSDFKLNHNGTDSFITEVGGGDLIIQGQDIILRDAGTLEKHIEMTQNGAVDLYHNGTKKLETDSGGVTVTGKVTSSNVTSSGTVLVGSTSYDQASADGDDIIIGTTSDTSKGLSIVGSTSGGIGNIFFSDGASYKNQGLIQYRHADDSMRISANQNERFRIFSSGNVQFCNPTGVGNSNPAFSGSTVGGMVRIDGTTPTLYMRETDRDMGAQDFYIGRTSETVYVGNQGGDIVFQTSDNGASTTERCRIRATSAGLAIGGTGDANTLDDYEEGTWTPQLNFSGTNNAASFDIQQGMYRKIGTTVFLAYSLRSTHFNGSSGAVRISNLPFSSTNSPVANISTAGVFPIQGVSFTGEFISQQLNATIIELYGVSKSTSSNVYTSIGVSEMNATGSMFIKGSIFYNVA